MYRWTQNRGCIGAIAIGFAVVGTLTVMFGDRADRLLGLVAIVMFGGAGAAWIAGEFLAKRAGKPHIGRVVLPNGGAAKGLIIPGSPGKARAAVAAQPELAPPRAGSARTRIPTGSAVGRWTGAAHRLQFGSTPRRLLPSAGPEGRTA